MAVLCAERLVFECHRLCRSQHWLPHCPLGRVMVSPANGQRQLLLGVSEENHMVLRGVVTLQASHNETTFFAEVVISGSCWLFNRET